MLRSMVSGLLDNALGDRLRTFAGYHPPLTLRPDKRGASISDLFAWRCDGEWQTCFELMHISSLIAGETTQDERIDIALFDNHGRMIRRTELSVAPLERRRIEIGGLLGDVRGAGTFACLHFGNPAQAIGGLGSHITERGYVGFRTRSKALWSYSHGNLNAVAADRPEGPLRFIHGHRRTRGVYRPQLSFEDCRSFELLFTNPTPRVQPLTVRVLGRAGTSVLETRTADLAPGALRIFGFENGAGRYGLVECSGRPIMWRPLIFKHYESHFDVLHG
jgi:hypothetical protein